MMIHTDVLIIGGGPSGLTAAKICCEAKCSTMLVDRSHILGGQLSKQTHKFFGSKDQHAKVRGIDIANILENDLKGFENLTIMLESTVVGLYEDKVATILHKNEYKKINAKVIILATGASEKFLAFENNDLPQIIGAGALQTLVNLYQVVPGKSLVMIGSGNIGLIVSYQMMQAGIEVKAIIEASDCIGGYKVHASKLKRCGVDIKTNTTIKRALGKDKLEAVEIVKLDANFNEIPGTSEIIETELCCVSVGLSPQHQLASMLNAKVGYVKELGGFVPLVDDHFMCSIEGVFACGDMVGIEEASSAMMEGYLCGCYVTQYLNQPHPQVEELIKYYENQLFDLRNGLFGKKTLDGINKRKEKLSHAS
jgi:sarcosine oxidase, subunit alpha